MSEKHICCQKIYSGFYGYACGKGAAYEHEGQWYCKTHHPPTVRAKNEARTAKWRAEWAEERAREKAAAEAAAEQKRKAEAYDQLAERCAELVEALEQLMHWQVKNVKVWHNSAYDHAHRTLAKCQPKPQEGTT